jgi:hypothetical protein
MRRTIIGTALGLLLTAVRLGADGRVDYLRDIKPILSARCYACHGALKQRSGLRLDTAALLRQGGDHGPAISIGNSADSLIIRHLTGSHGLRRMPPQTEGEPLTARQIGLIGTWVDQGAVAPADEKPEADPREHWGFRAPVRPAVPVVREPAWVRNPIDAFIGADRERRRLVPQPPANKRILLRRVYLDLIGLPPSLDELAAFEADDAPDAYERVVDRLLATKQYGERWGRHWMDIWRYSDPWGLGADLRNSQKHIWHWRDWIVESLNADKGYDQMVREMLAADELYPNDAAKLRATGFLVRSYFKFNRNTWLDETVEHMSKALLGLTFNCAKCHDHKYDPIAQKDYYRLRAFFEPYQVRIDQVPGEVDLEKDGLPRAFDCHLEAPTYLFQRGDEKQPVKDKPLTPGIPELLALGALDIQPVSLRAEAHSPGLRSFVLEDHLQAVERRIMVARESLEKAVEAATPKSVPTIPLPQAHAAVRLAEKTLAAAELQPATLRARAAADRARAQQPPAANKTELARLAARAERQAAVARADEEVARAELELARAEPAKKADADKKLAAALDALDKARKAVDAAGETYTPLRGSLKTLESNVETEASRNQPFPTMSSGRRSALARWLTDRRHALTARVAVNHMWARHFGRPLVQTVTDFGRKGTAPTHPALLDYLAIELMDNHWSMKHLHRLMVTSSTYRMTSSAAGMAQANALDAENRFYWRMNPARMEAEVVRDSLLFLAGELDPIMGGPPIDPTKDPLSRRRSLYFVHSHNDHHPFLAMFDEASVLECYRRAESIVPQQALALENSKLALAAADKIATRLARQPGAASDTQFVQAAFAAVLSCRPTAAEQSECEQALMRLTPLLQHAKQPEPERRARVTVIHALLNHNDFITIR